MSSKNSLKRTPSVNFTLGFALLFLATIGLINAFVVDRLTDDLSGISEKINITGRLRMVSQKSIVDIVLSGNNVSDRISTMNRFSSEFVNSLDALEYGGRVYGNRIKNSSKELSEQFEIVRSHWQIYQRELSAYLERKHPSSALTEEIKLQKSSQKVLGELESLMDLTLKSVQRRESEGRHLLVGLLAIDLFSLLAVYLFIRRRMILPILNLARISELFGSGQYWHRTHPTKMDEIGRLAVSFNKMADQLVSDMDKIAANARRDRQLLLNEQKMTEAVERSPVSVVITNPHGIIEYANSRFSEISGYCNEEIIGQPIGILKSGMTPVTVYQDLWQAINAGKQWRGNLLNRKKMESYFGRRLAFLHSLMIRTQSCILLLSKKTLLVKKISN